jgi:hypothetical protein
VDGIFILRLFVIVAMSQYEKNRLAKMKLEKNNVKSSAIGL